jgi:hypothetical protein
MEPDAVVKRGVAPPGGLQNIGGEPRITGAGFDEIQGWSRAEYLGHFGDLDFQELAEERTDIDAGKKIARATRPLGRAGVITDLGIVERKFHERGHRDWPALTNYIGNPQSEIDNLQSIINQQSAIINS